MATKAEKQLIADLQAKLASMTGNQALVTNAPTGPVAAPGVVAYASLDATAKSAIKAALAGAVNKSQQTSSLLTECVATAMAYAKGLPISDTDRETMASDVVTDNPQWGKDTAKNKKSQCVTVLKAYDRLDAAIVAYRALNNGNCNYNEGITIARRLNDGMEIAAAAKAAYGEPKPVLTKEQEVVEKDKAAKERAEKALKAWLTRNPQHAVATFTFCASVGMEIKLK